MEADPLVDRVDRDACRIGYLFRGPDLPCPWFNELDVVPFVVVLLILKRPIAESGAVIGYPIFYAIEGIFPWAGARSLGEQEAFE